MPAAFFIVRSTVADPAKRAAFDKWYQSDFWPDALKSFGVKKAWRFWSLSDPAIHQATYQFGDEAALDRVMNEEVPRLIDKFVRDWPDVPRVRETFVLAQEFWSVAACSRRLIEPSAQRACVLVRARERTHAIFPAGRPMEENGFGSFWWGRRCVSFGSGADYHRPNAIRAPRRRRIVDRRRSSSRWRRQPAC
jgi:hypothetical protein